MTTRHSNNNSCDKNDSVLFSIPNAFMFPITINTNQIVSISISCDIILISAHIEVENAQGHYHTFPL